VLIDQSVQGIAASPVALLALYDQRTDLADEVAEGGAGKKKPRRSGAQSFTINDATVSA
jgi:hypothetical protein